MEVLEPDTLDGLCEDEQELIKSFRFTHHLYRRYFEDEANMMADQMAVVRQDHPVLSERRVPTWYQRVTNDNNQQQQQQQGNVS